MGALSWQHTCWPGKVPILTNQNEKHTNSLKYNNYRSLVSTMEINYALLKQFLTTSDKYRKFFRGQIIGKFLTILLNKECKPMNVFSVNLQSTVFDIIKEIMHMKEFVIKRKINQ